MTPRQMVLQFLLKNWKGVIIVLLLQAQLAGLQEIHKKQLADMEASLEIYKTTIEQVERDYQESQEELLEVIEDRREEFGRQFSEDPEELSETIMLMYGFDYVP